MLGLIAKKLGLAPRQRDWRTDLQLAPLREPVFVQTGAGEATDGRAPRVAVRTAEGWLSVSPRGEVAPLQGVDAWAPLHRAKPNAPQGSMMPNLFVLGAGKSGTTSLHAILRQHPDIHASKEKEPSFFCSYFQVVNDPVAYFQLFDSPKRYRAESSHVYLTNPDTAPTLKTLFPDAKFIVTLRDPKQRAHSLYSHMRRLPHPVDRKPYEDIPDFLSALRAEDARFTSKEFFANCRQYFWNFLYIRSCLYDEQLRRYFALFDRAQFHVLSLGELSTNPAAATEAIMRFLGLDPVPVKNFTFDVKNQSREEKAPYDGESERIMSKAFDGLTQRVDELVGRPLDWSM
jgi:hypothetical protein